MIELDEVMKMKLGKKVLIIILLGGIVAIGYWALQTDMFKDDIPSRVKKVLRMSRDLNGK